MRSVYLDNNATTRTDPQVVAAMLPFFTDDFGNASSGHNSGAVAAGAVRAARRKVQALLGAEHEQEIVFTSGGTEANNAALLSAFELGGGRDELIVSAVEHPSILAVCDTLKRRAIRVHRIAVDGKGRLDIAAYRRALGSRTALVSLMWANNETGTLFPVAELAEMAREAGALFHTDAVQAAGKTAIDLKAAKIDMLSLSGHKFHGPKGIGVLYIRKGVTFTPLIRGGRQERARRGGTENVPAIAGLGKAAELAELRLGEDAAKVEALRNRFESSIQEHIEDCAINGDVENRLPSTSNIAFDGAEGEAILRLFDKAGIAASSGSACTSGAMEPSHVLRAMKISYTAAHGAIRFSFSRDNSQADIDYVLGILPGIVAKARAASPFARRRNADLNPSYGLFA